MKQVNYTNIFEPIIDLQSQWFNQITLEWGKSSVQLKNYLKTYYAEDLNYATKLGCINVNYLLPIKKGFWSGKKAVFMLTNAIQAKAIIMNSIGDLEDNFGKLVYESLRLFLRINSLKTYLTLDEFHKIIETAYYNADKDEVIEEIINLCNEYRPKRKQTMYHFTKDDFNLIDGMNMKLGEAFEFWKNNVLPNLLENYKSKLINEWIAKNNRVKNSNSSFEKFKADLDLIKIKEPSYRNFEKYLKIHNISYQKS